METPEKKYYVFYNHVPNSNFVFADGELAQFKNGRYTTDNEARAHALTLEIQRGNQNIYVDPTKLTATEEELDPMAELKAKIIAEYLAKNGGKVEDSTSEQGKLNVTDSKVIQDAAANSNGEAVGVGTLTTPSTAKLSSSK